MENMNEKYLVPATSMTWTRIHLEFYTIFYISRFLAVLTKKTHTHI